MQEIDVRTLQAELERLTAELSDLKQGLRPKPRRLFSRMATGSQVVLSILAGVLILGAVSYAGQITLPWIFENGTVADATQVNSNFSVLRNESNGHDSRIASLETNLPLHLLQDGSEPFTGSLTVNQNLLANGNTTLGSTTDKLTTINDILRLTPRATVPFACDESTVGASIVQSRPGPVQPIYTRVCVCAYVNDPMFPYQWLALAWHTGASVVCG